MVILSTSRGDFGELQWISALFMEGYGFRSVTIYQRYVVSESLCPSLGCIMHGRQVLERES